MKILKEETETIFRHFNTFKDFVNAKLDVNKDENVHVKMFALEKENQCLRNENKNEKAIIKMLIESSNKNAGIWKTVEKKNSTLNSKINSTNYETMVLKICFNASKF